jgi:hypothetical protein
MTTTTPSLTPSLASSSPEEPKQPVLSVQAALFLKQHHRELVEAWATSLWSQPSSNYSLRPVEELRDTCGECLRAYESLLGEGDSDPLWQFIDRICRMRAGMYFPPADVVEALMLGLDAVDALLRREARDLSSFADLTAEVRRCTRAALKAFANSYWIHLELAHTSI